jgi:3-oxoacyl-(acyl-carrier-protein) synthase
MSLVVTGAGAIVLGDTEPSCDPLPFLDVPKNRKYMGLQDELAVVAAGRALADARLPSLGARAGLFFAVGYIPFRYEDIANVVEASLEDDGSFSMERFVTRGFPKGRPLMAFRCLPNMPAYHVSACFDVRGPYHVSYPGIGAFYGALEEAVIALEDDRVDVALVGGVAHQHNFLVEHHFARLDPPVAAERLRDGAGVLILEREADARARKAALKARLSERSVRYVPFDPREVVPPHDERFDDHIATTELGPASLPAAIALRGAPLRHALSSREGLIASSTWEPA